MRFHNPVNLEITLSRTNELPLSDDNEQIYVSLQGKLFSFDHHRVKFFLDADFILIIKLAMVYYLFLLILI